MVRSGIFVDRRADHRRTRRNLCVCPAAQLLYLYSSTTRHRASKPMSSSEPRSQRPEWLPQHRPERRSLVPSGFECVAHPVFLRADLSRSLAATTATTAAASTGSRGNTITTISQTAAAAWDVETLGKGDGDHDFGARKGRGAAAGDREVDPVCPICLGKFERAVTLTSCLHSFCHTW